MCQLKKNFIFNIITNQYSLGNFGIAYESPDIKCFSWNPEVSLQANPQALSHFFHSFKPVSEIFTFASTRDVDGNMITEVIPPEGLVQARSIGNTPFEVLWSFACIKSLIWGPGRVALSFFFP